MELVFPLVQLRLYYFLFESELESARHLIVCCLLSKLCMVKRFFVRCSRCLLRKAGKVRGTDLGKMIAEGASLRIINSYVCLFPLSMLDFRLIRWRVVLLL